MSPKLKPVDSIIPAFLLLTTFWISITKVWDHGDLLVDAHLQKPGNFQVFFDAGNGFNENDSVRLRANDYGNVKSKKVTLPIDDILSLRIDPADNDGRVKIKRLDLKLRGRWVALSLLGEDYPIVHGAERLEYDIGRDVLKVIPVKFNADPYFVVTDVPQASSVTEAWIQTLLVNGLIAAVLVISLIFSPGFWNQARVRILHLGRLLYHCIARGWFETDNKSVRWSMHLALQGLLLFMLLAFWNAGTFQIGSYGDETHKWLHAKILLGEVPQSEWIWDHHTTRIAIMAATWLVQLFFGTDPVLYYVAPFVANVLVILGIYWLGCRIVHPVAGFAAGVWILLWTPAEFHQLMTSPFIEVFTILATWSTFHALRAAAFSKACYYWTALAALFGLCAYFSWVLALFFLPAMGWLLLWNKGWKPAFMFAGILLVGFLVETFYYGVLQGIPMARIGIIASEHLEAIAYEPEWMDLFRRYLYLGDNRGILLFTFFALLPLVWIFRKHVPKPFLQFVLIPASFCFFLTFCINDIAPLSLVLQHHQPRYIFPVLPFVCLFIASLVVYGFLILSRNGFFKWLRYPATQLAVCVFAVFILSRGLSENLHPDQLSFRQRIIEISESVSLGRFIANQDIAVIQMNDPVPKGTKFFVDMLYPREILTPSPTPNWVRIGDRVGTVLVPGYSGVPFEDDIREFYQRDVALFVEHMPFRSGFGTISGLGNARHFSKVYVYFGAWDRKVLWHLGSRLDMPGLRSLSRESISIEKDSEWAYWESTPNGLTRFPYWRCDAPHARRPAHLRMATDWADGARSLRIPMHTQTKTEGFSLAVRDAQSGKEWVKIAHIALAPDTWYYLDVPRELLPDLQRLSITVLSAGLNPESHLNLGLPMWIFESTLPLEESLEKQE